ncbi:MAG: DUF4037 domain-containing protein [Bacillota bacterium]
MTRMLEEAAARRVLDYFASHPVFDRHRGDICIALTGSFAFGLGGKGADVDVKALAPGAAFDAIRAELAEAGRIAKDGAPEEDLTGVVGDYSLESLEAVWERVQRYGDLTQVFIYGNLVYLDGRRDFLESLVRHCQRIPDAVLKRAVAEEQASLSQALYGFLRSFQNEDPVARNLTRAALARAAMRLAFLTEGQAPPYDKHLFRLLTRLRCGKPVAEAVLQFLTESGESVEAALYATVAAADDWHDMYAAALETPALAFRRSVHDLLGLAPV